METTKNVCKMTSAVELLEISKVKALYSEKEIRDASYEMRLLKNNPGINMANWKGINFNRQYGTNEDWVIYGLDKLVEVPTFETSLKIWNTLRNASPKIFYATYIPNKSYEQKYKDYPFSFRKKTRFNSLIVSTLIDNCWVPNNEGVFHKPNRIALENIHLDFQIEPQFDWYSKLGLMRLEEMAAKLEEICDRDAAELSRQKAEAAKILGFSMADTELFTKYLEIRSLENG